MKILSNSTYLEISRRRRLLRSEFERRLKRVRSWGRGRRFVTIPEWKKNTHTQCSTRYKRNNNGNRDKRSYGNCGRRTVAGFNNGWPDEAQNGRGNSSRHASGNRLFRVREKTCSRTTTTVGFPDVERKRKSEPFADERVEQTAGLPGDLSAISKTRR